MLGVWTAFSLKDASSLGRSACRRFLCAEDKLAVFQELQEKCERPSVMCGDSLSDLGALLAADFGVVIGSSSSLRKVMSLTGIGLQPLSTGEVMSSTSANLISLFELQVIACH